MPAGARRPWTARLVVSLLVLLVVSSLLLPSGRPGVTRSSFGTIPEGHGALFELLMKRGWSHGRSFAAFDGLPAGATLWWVEPGGVCSARIALGGEVDVLDAEAVEWSVAPWIAAGGRAVVWLQPEGSDVAVCDSIAGVRLPRRAAAESRAVQGRIAPVPRQLAEESLLAFESARDWGVAAELGGLPFVIERRVGEGELVVVADAGFVHNARLGLEDSAPLAIDLVRAYGVPYLDEREHGFVPESSAPRYLARSRAFPVFLGLALAGVAVVWRGNALPARSVPELDPEVPTAETFVESMASLYARTRDRGRILERYRQLSAARLRRHFGMPADVPAEALAKRIQRLGRVSDESVERLVARAQTAAPGPGPGRSAPGSGPGRFAPRSAAELRDEMRALDRLVEEVTR